MPDERDPELDYTPDEIRELREEHLQNFVSCASKLISCLAKTVPVETMARDHFMDSLSLTLARIDPESGEELSERATKSVLQVIGSCYVLMHTAANASDQVVEKLTDALRYAAIDPIVRHNLHNEEEVA